MRALSIVLITSAALSAPAAAASLGRGDVCRLTTALKAFAKPDASSSRMLIETGHEVTVLDVEEGWALIRTGKDASAYLKRAAAEKWCTVLKKGTDTAAAAPAADASAPAPTTVPDAAAPAAESPAELEVSADGPGGAAPAGAPTSPTPPTPPTTPARPSATAGAESAARDKVRIAVTDIRSGIDIESSTLVAMVNAATERITRLGAFSAVSSEDIKQMLSYQAQQQMLGCDRPDCVSALGEALGAEYLLSTTLTAAAGQRLLQLQLSRVADGAIENRASRRVDADGDLTEAYARAAEAVVQPVLERYSGLLRLTANEEGATVRIDGRIVAVTPAAPVVVAGGWHTLSLEKEGFVRYSRDLQMLQGVAVAHEARMTPSAEYLREFRKRAQWSRWISYGAGGLGGAGLVAGAIMLIVSTSATGDLNREIAAYNQAPERLTSIHDELSNRRSLLTGLGAGAIIGLAVGAVGLAAGAVVYLIGDDPDRYEAHTSTSFGDESRVWLGPAGISGSF